MKRFVPLSLTFTLLLTTCLTSYAQIQTNKAVTQQSSQQKATQTKNLYNQVLTLARQKGWPLTFKGRHGRIAVLRGIDLKGNPVYITTLDNIISAATIGTNQIQPGGSTGLALNGSSSAVSGKMGEWDEGQPLHTHVELKGRVVQKDADATPADHSTHVAGTMMATGINPLVKGMAFSYQSLQAYDYNNDDAEMMAASPDLLVSNHSYGDIAGWYYDDTYSRWEFWGNYGDTADYKFGYYDSETQYYDSIAYNAPEYLIVKAASNNRGETGPEVGQPYYRYNAQGVMAYAGDRPAGISSNDGFDCIPTTGVAKNILTIGAVNPIPGGYTNVNDVVMSDFSSWGPADDGRIKPDVVSDGVNVLSSSDAGDSAYEVMSGTSMATPAMTGSSLLLQEYYNKLHSTFMRSATLRGLIIHTADEAGPANGPDYMFGWGLADIKKAAEVIKADTASIRTSIIYESTLGNTASDSTYTLSVVASGQGNLTATICWTDPPGTPVTTNILNNPTKMLVNDLDVRITSNGTTWYPYILDRKNPGNAATTGDDTLNNVEKIVVQNVVPGQTYTIKVTHKGTLARGTQAYSLLVSGIGGSAYCTSQSTNTATTSVDSVVVGGIQNGTAACAQYTNNTTQTASLQPNQKVALRVRLSSCDGTTTRNWVVKTFIDYNSDGQFESNELAATSAVLSGVSGVLYTDTIVAPSSLTVGNYGLLRIVAEETTSASAVAACGTYPNGQTQDYTAVFASPTNDVGVTQVVNPAGTACAADSQLITISIKNFGSATQTNVPVTAVITNGGSTVATLTATYPDSISAFSSVQYTFQTGFNATAGQTYTISCYTSLSTDQMSSDDTTTSALIINAASGTPVGTAELCGSNTVYLKATNGSNDVAFWYDSENAITPIASGNDTSTTEITANKTYYLGLNDAVTHVGPANKLVYSGGGYNAYQYNFVNFTNYVPVTIENARLYIGYPGQIQFVAADISNFDTASGSYEISEISATTVNAYATTPNPVAGAVTGNNASDTGAIFYLGLSVPTAGSHIIYIVSDGNATIFRNSGITTNPYPFTIPGVFSITSNSAVSTTSPTLYEQYYYFFYDMRVKEADCPTTRVPVVATTGTAPTITLNGNVLTSTSSAAYQWYVNGSALSGKTAQTDTAVLSGTYTVAATDSLGCTLISNAVTYSGQVLQVYPNPTKGDFTIAFVVSNTADVGVEVTNILGQVVYRADYGNLSGAYTEVIPGTNLAEGVYGVKLVIGNKSYSQKVLIVR